MMRKALLLAVPLAAVLLLAACGGGVGEKPSAATPTPAAQKTPTGGAATVEIKAVPTLKFNTKELRVPANTDVTIRFVNEDTGVPHDFTIWTKKNGDKMKGTDIITGPDEASITVNLAPGEYYFNCTVHPTEMEGKVIAK